MAHRALAILRRRLFNFLAILSLLLCLATVALWMRSYWRNDDLEHGSGAPGGWHRVEFSSDSGSLDIRVVEGTTPIAYINGWIYFADRAGANAGVTRLFFGYLHVVDPVSRSIPHVSLRHVWFPHWFPALLFAILPALRLRSLLRTRRRHFAGLCPHCGYDLRATPDRCPECGHVPKALAGR